MDYAKFAIILWIIATIIIGIVGRKAFSKIFGLPKNKFLKVDVRAYLFCAALLGAAISLVLTFFVRSLP